MVASSLLQFQNEEDAFWMVISMLVNFKYDKLLLLNDLFKQTCYQLELAIKAYLPKLSELFDSFNISVEFFAS